VHTYTLLQRYRERLAQPPRWLRLHQGTPLLRNPTTRLLLKSPRPAQHSVGRYTHSVGRYTLYAARI
jgi:hypothetical protein